MFVRAYVGSPTVELDNDKVPHSLNGSAVVPNADWATAGNGTVLPTWTGGTTGGNCVSLDATGNLMDSGSPCGRGGSGAAGPAPTRMLRQSARLDFPSIGANSCESLSVTVAGAADGNEVALGVPNALGSLAGVSWSAWVSAANTVTVRGCNATGRATIDPAPATVKVTVIP